MRLINQTEVITITYSKLKVTAVLLFGISQRETSKSIYLLYINLTSNGVQTVIFVFMLSDNWSNTVDLLQDRIAQEFAQRGMLLPLS
jgi:hypothetical protein